MTAEDPRARVRGYLLAQAEKNDFAVLWPKVMEQRGALLAACAELIEAQAAFRPPAARVRRPGARPTSRGTWSHPRATS